MQNIAKPALVLPPLEKCHLGLSQNGPSVPKLVALVRKLELHFAAAKRNAKANRKHLGNNCNYLFIQYSKNKIFSELVLGIKCVPGNGLQDPGDHVPTPVMGLLYKSVKFFV